MGKSSMMNAEEGDCHFDRENEGGRPGRYSGRHSGSANDLGENHQEHVNSGADMQRIGFGRRELMKMQQFDDAIFKKQGEAEAKTKNEQREVGALRDELKL